jgi:hypothetical protein
MPAQQLDAWLPTPLLRVSYRRETVADPERLWRAATAVKLADTRMLGRLIRWRIPGTPPGVSFDELFRSPPFIVLADEPGERLLSGLVGRIWTLRRDYPQLSDPAEFRAWSTPGTARVLFANWIERSGGGRAAVISETRVEAFGRQGRLGVAAVRPLVSAFGHLIGSDALEVAIRGAEETAKSLQQQPDPPHRAG